MIAPLPFTPTSPTTPPTEVELLQRYLPLVRSVVNRMVAHLPASVEAADLHSVGLTGLVAAVRKFDPAQGRTFEGYAVQRIRGAVLDELRRLDTLPRTARAKARQLRSAVQGLEQELGRAPQEVEIRQRLGLGVRDYDRFRRQTEAVTWVALDAPRRTDGEQDGQDWHEVLADPVAKPTADGLEHQETLTILRERLSTLAERPRRILQLYYQEGRRLSEIATIFGVTEARICQIHAETLAALRRSLPYALEA